MLLYTRLTPSASGLDVAAQIPDGEYARQAYARILSRENRFEWIDRVDWKVLRVVSDGRFDLRALKFRVILAQTINGYNVSF